MKLSFRILFFLTVLLYGASITFASEENTTTTEQNTTITSQDSDSTANEARKEKIKEEVTSYIIDSYKAQGDKIVKELDQTLQKTLPEKNARIEAYDKILSTLEARRTYNRNSEKVTDISKKIIDAFLTHMIDAIEKKENDLKVN